MSDKFVKVNLSDLKKVNFSLKGMKEEKCHHENYLMSLAQAGLTTSISVKSLKCRIREIDSLYN